MTSVPRICQKYISRVSFAAPSFPSYASWSGHGRIAWLLPRASLLAPTCAPSHARYAISCHLMYTHTPYGSSSKCRNTPITNQLHVSAFQVGRSVWLNKDYFPEKLLLIGCCEKGIEQIPSVPTLSVFFGRGSGSRKTAVVVRYD